MSKVKTYESSVSARGISGKIADYVMLIKLRLTLLVVFTSLLGYMIVAGSMATLFDLLLLAIGGFLITGASNAMNQVLEKDFDILMKRTENRPIASGRMRSAEGVLFVGLTCTIGLACLAFFNPVTVLLGALAFVSYAFIYTPLKRYSTISVAIGAVPGALPVVIGCTAFEGSISLFALSIFALQFLWQFPHFWSIGYLSFDDYKNAGFKLLPEKEGKIDRDMGLYSFFYVLLMLPITMIPLMTGDEGWLATIIALLSAAIFGILCIDFHRKFDRPSALKVMFGSFFYLPIVLLAYWIF